MSTNIRINHKGWVIEVIPLDRVPVMSHGLVEYIYKYKAIDLAMGIMKNAMVATSDWSYVTFTELPEHERKSIVKEWLDKSRNFGQVEEPNIVYE